MKIGLDMELEQYPKSIRVSSNTESVIKTDIIRNTILTAYNNSMEFPDEAIQNLLSAILEIQDFETKKKIALKQRKKIIEGKQN